jgi:hypothetical protein
MVNTPVEFDRAYGAVGHEMRSCTCRHHVGPVPLETFYAADADLARQVLDYERRHQERTIVTTAAEHATT